MRSFTTGVAVLGLLAVLMPSGAPAASPASPGSEITAAIESRLLDEGGVSAGQIAAQDVGGIAILSGTVQTPLVQRRAALLAKTVAGVRGVVNLIRVAASNRPAAEVQGDVTASLAADPATAGQPIQVSDIDGTVTLGGRVFSAAEKHLAGLSALGVPGVRRVENALAVASLQPRLAPAIEADTGEILSWDPWLAGRPVKIAVEAGKVVLSGAVASRYEKERADRLAARVGASTVVDRLRINPALLRPHERVSPRRPDAAIATAITAEFYTDPRLHGSVSELRVAVAGAGQAFLSGTAADFAAKRAAREDARNAVGVRRVVDGTGIPPVARLPDTALRANVQQALRRDPYIALDDIDISVRDSRVLLRGVVPTAQARRRAAIVAGQVSGVAGVTDGLTVLRERPSLAEAPQPRDRGAQ